MTTSHAHDVIHAHAYIKHSADCEAVKVFMNSRAAWLLRGVKGKLSDHLVQVPLEVALLHVDLLVGLDHILQLLLSLLPLLELKKRKEEQRRQQ